MFCVFYIGVYVLVKVGFLDGKCVIIYWEKCQVFMEEFFEVDLIEYIFIFSVLFYCLFGGILVIDLMLFYIL